MCIFIPICLINSGTLWNLLKFSAKGWNYNFPPQFAFFLLSFSLSFSFLLTVELYIWNFWISLTNVNLLLSLGIGYIIAKDCASSFFPIIAWGDLCKWFAIHLAQETPISCKSRGSNLCVYLKNTLETAQGIKSMHIWTAAKYLKDVTTKKQCVSFCTYNGGVDKWAQARLWGWMQGE